MDRLALPYGRATQEQGRGRRAMSASWDLGEALPVLGTQAPGLPTPCARGLGPAFSPIL